MPGDFHISAKAAIIGDSRMLILKNTQGWDLPGGRLEAGEDLQGALRREIGEELPGVGEIKIGRMIGWHHHPPYPIEGRDLLVTIFEVSASLPDPLVMSDEHIGFEWLPLDEAREVLRIFDIHWNQTP